MQKTLNTILTPKTKTKMFPVMTEPEMLQRSQKVQEEIDRWDIGGDLQTLRQDPTMPDEEFIDLIRKVLTPVQLSVKWPGNRRKVDDANQSEMVKAVDADQTRFSTSKQLYDFENSRWKGVKAVKNQAVALWKKLSIDYPNEEGTRFIRRDLIEAFVAGITELQQQLQEEAVKLNEQFDDMLREGEMALGKTYKRSDYPENLLDSFAINYSFRDVGCAVELKHLTPQLYADQCSRVRTEIDETLYKFETTYIAKFDEMVDHLIDKLQPNEDGTKKIFKASAIDNITEAIEDFRKTGIGSSTKMKQLVDKLNEITSNIDAKYLRKSETAAKTTAERLTKLKETIETLKLEDEQATRIRRAGRQLQRFGEVAKK